MSEGGGREYRADDHVWAGRMTGQHGPVLRFMRHDAQREQLLSSWKEREERRKAEKLWSSFEARAKELQRKRVWRALTRTVGVRATVVSFMLVAYGR